MNISKKIKLAILKNEDPFDHLPWVRACDQYEGETDYQVIDLTAGSWMEKICTYCPDILLRKPSGKTSLFRKLYQERLEILTNELGYPSFPGLDEVRIYENKRFFAYWAKANNVPHPETRVFYHEKEALAALESLGLPLVGKINIGASGNGIRVLRTKYDAQKYVSSAFHQGLAARTGPKLGKGKLAYRVWQKIIHPDQLLNRLKTYRQIATDRQTGFVILQQFIPHQYEWRAVRIGDSFFAHKKMALSGKASGSLIKQYDNPPAGLLDFIHCLTDRFGFKSVAVDIFEPKPEQYLVNEIQCIFGQSDPYQMLVDEKPGRYVLGDRGWIFQEGNFNTNESYDLRLETAIALYQTGNN